MNIKNILDTLSATTKRNEKLSILAAQKDNILLQQTIVAALDPYTQYYIRKIPAYTRFDSNNVSLADFLVIAGKISNRDVTGNEAKSILATTLANMSEDDAYVGEKIILKDLRAGIQSSSINKIWPKLVATYPCLLARKSSEKDNKNITFPAYSQLKLDGMRVNFLVDGNSVTSFSRNGRAVIFHNALDNQLIHLNNVAGGHPTVYDGELVVLDENGKILPRKTGNGILGKAIKGTIGPEESSRVRLVIWDTVPMEDFKNEICEIEYQERFTQLVKDHATASSDENENIATILEGRKIFADRIRIVESRIVNDWDEINLHYADALERGEEGTMIKNLNHIWQNKRSKDLIKMKVAADADLIVTDWLEGTGINEGFLGAVMCTDATGTLRVRVGSGFSRDQRQKWTKEDLVGKIIECKYNEVIKNEAGETSLFLPIFQYLRIDKDVPNSINELK